MCVSMSRPIGSLKNGRWTTGMVVRIHLQFEWALLNNITRFHTNSKCYRHGMACRQRHVWGSDVVLSWHDLPTILQSSWCLTITALRGWQCDHLTRWLVCHSRARRPARVLHHGGICDWRLAVGKNHRAFGNREVAKILRIAECSGLYSVFRIRTTADT